MSGIVTQKKVGARLRRHARRRHDGGKPNDNASDGDGGGRRGRRRKKDADGDRGRSRSRDPDRGRDRSRSRDRSPKKRDRSRSRSRDARGGGGRGKASSSASPTKKRGAKGHAAAFIGSTMASSQQRTRGAMRTLALIIRVQRSFKKRLARKRVSRAGAQRRAAALALTTCVRAFVARRKLLQLRQAEQTRIAARRQHLSSFIFVSSPHSFPPPDNPPSPVRRAPKPTDRPP